MDVVGLWGKRKRVIQKFYGCVKGLGDTRLKTVLWVGSGDTNAAADAEMVKTMGYVSIAASDREDAFKILCSEQRIDLLLLDIPVHSSSLAVETSGELLRHRDLPLVLITSHLEREEVDRLRAIPHYGVVDRSAGIYVFQSCLEMAMRLFEDRQALLRSEKHFRQFVENSSDFVWTEDLADGRITYLNRSGMILAAFSTQLSAEPGLVGRYRRLTRSLGRYLACSRLSPCG